MSDRRAGILLHPTCLPGPWGMGDVGPAARAFVRDLGDAGQRLWQILPLSPTDGTGSPYAGGSAFAADPLLVSLDDLLDDGLLTAAEVGPFLADCEAGDPAHVDPALQRREKAKLVRIAARRLVESGGVPGEARPGILAWAEFIAPRAGTTVKIELAVQALFDRQWARLRRVAAEANVLIVGDLPIFVGGDSADVLAHPELFLLGKDGRPEVVAGCPPDFFSPLGQRWGNPHYDWDAARAEGFAWWRSRLVELLERVDIVRMDHFRGFAAAWAIPVGASDARTGSWSPGPGVEVFTALCEAVGAAGRLEDGRLPVIAEDLDASPLQVGLLAAGTGMGMMTGSLVMARMTPRHRGRAYLAGLVVAFGFLILFAIGTSYWFVFAAIVASGVGSGVFGATQSTLVVAAVPEASRGKALGLLSMAIGGLPPHNYPAKNKLLLPSWLTRPSSVAKYVLEI